MAADTKAVDQIVEALLESPFTAGGRMELVRELVWRGSHLSNEMLEGAWLRLMECLTE